MSIFKCKMCGGALEINNNETVAVCEYCGTKQTLPKMDNERKVNLYDRANHFRRNNEFDKAMGIYEQILNEDNTDAESYWSIVLCRYGIEYVEDPASHKRIPTVNRAQFTSVFDDEDYKSALKYADAYQREVYESEANAINEIQKGILSISRKEEPFDVFICYKETDNQGRRTQDSVLAQELYYELLEEGFKVFFAKITLEDKLGQEYEPYIFAALNSAKVMVVLGTRPEHFNAVWVKNEWSRYLALIKSGADKMLIPAYRDMDPYDLPEEFSHLQAQDMSKLGFMQDLVRGISKIATAEVAVSPVKETIIAGNTNEVPLLKRAFMFLEDGEFERADEFCEQVLNMNPENAGAYLGKLMAELKVNVKEDLANCAEAFDYRKNYQKALRFGDESLTLQLKGYIKHINERNEKERLEELYQNAVRIKNSSEKEMQYRNAAKAFQIIKGYRNADALAKECLEKAEILRKEETYQSAKDDMVGYLESSYHRAIRKLETIKGWKDVDELIDTCNCKIKEIKAQEEAARIERERIQEQIRIKKEEKARRNRKIIKIATPIVIVLMVFLILLNVVIIPSSKYNKSIELLKQEKYEQAIPILVSIVGYKDSETLVREHIARVENRIVAGNYHTVGLKKDGTVVAVGSNSDGECDVSGWTDIVAVSAGSYHTVGLKTDGTVVAVGYNGSGRCNVTEWTDIVSISAGNYHTVGLKKDGTVVAVGSNEYGQCNVTEWTDIVSISAGGYHTVGLKSDGTVVAVGSNTDGECNVSKWTNILTVFANSVLTVGLKQNGTIVVAGDDEYNNYGDTNWMNIMSISASSHHAVGLKTDGTVVATGQDSYGQCNVAKWTNVISISAGNYHTVGIKTDGTVVATGDNEFGQCDVSDWNLFE